jgi:hypothetical protein
MFSRSIAVAAVLLSAIAGTAPAQQPPALTVTRELLITPEEADLNDTRYLAVSPRGHILVSQSREGFIKVFAPGGQSQKIGRPGEGPGEFRFPTQIGFVGDSLYAIDHALVRVYRFSADFKFVRGFPEPFSPVAPTMPYPHFYDFTRAVLPGGDLRANATIPGSGSARPSWAARLDSNAIAIVSITPAGDFRKLLLLVPPPAKPCSVSALFTHKNGRGDQVTSQIPYCPVPLVTDDQGAAGGVASVEVGLVSRTTGSYGVRAVDDHGVAKFTRSISYTPVPITKASRDSLARARTVYEKSREFIPESPNPDPYPTYPPIRRVLLGRDYSVWLEEHSNTPGHRWLVLDAKGSTVGSVTLPPEVTLKVVELGRAWGTTTDADGLQGIVRYRVGR